MFSKILIANRGEIACRVAASAQRLGVQTVAVYSEADANARHVALCDEAFLIGGAAAQDSYLCADKIIAAALASGAQAIHPGYGFLSENAAFADACAAAGLVFIGPPAAAMRAMGSKSAAKTLMETAQVPLVPGYHGDNQEPGFLQQQADAIGYPVLLKASAGGGGKGMRIVTGSADFVAALASCQREAASSFGDAKVLLEKYLTQPRHIEIQVFADTHGNCVHLFERDCSVQRRHQKVLEEAPAPGMTVARRAAMGAAAVAAAQAVGYVGAGTVEFIVNQDASFYFMEMNTRLQVEHPVTEMITGLDLVEWQLQVAAGAALPLQQAQLAINGHALEARIYAENPEKGFLPAIGTLRHLRTPAAVSFTVAGSDSTPAAVRIDSGVRDGDSITPHYDPMIAKLIVWGADREQALTRMREALAAYQVTGLATNIAFLQRLIASVPFASADLDTGLIERHHAALFPPAPIATDAQLALAAISVLLDEAEASAGVNAADPWSDARGWRMNHGVQRTLRFIDSAGTAETPYTPTLRYADGGWILQAGGAPLAVRVALRDGADLHLHVGARLVRGTVVRDAGTLHVFCDGVHAQLQYLDPLAHAGQAEVAGGRLTAPMPGKIAALLVAVGDSVEPGAPLLVMEAMKMEHIIHAPSAGIIDSVLYAIGDQVDEGAQLLALRPA